MACRESDIATPGSFVAYEILDESILIVRTGEGASEVAAFYNVCQHRGRRLRDEERGQLGPTIACRFHGWQYTHEGEIAQITMERDWEDCPAFDKSRLCIPPVKLARWGGWVWINLDPEAEPLEAWLGSAKAMLDPFALADLRPRWWKQIRAPVNWKIVVEAFNEGYHSGATHTCGIDYRALRSPTGVAGNHALFFSEGGAFTAYKDERGKWVRPGSFTENLWANNRHLARTLHAMVLEPTLRASERLRALPEAADPLETLQALYALTREEIEASGARFPEGMTLDKLYAAGTDWHLFPNSIVLPTLDGALWYRVRPHPRDRDACLFDIWSFGRFAPGEEPAVEREAFDGFETFRGQCEFLEEDFANLEAVHLGTKSRGFAGATLNPVQKGTISHFHQMLRRFIEP